MVTGKFLTGKDDLTEVFHIRHKVFCEEQHIAAELERDALDSGAIHVLIHDHDKNVATGRLVDNNNVFSIGRIAVLKEERGKYYGDFVVRMLLDRAFRLGAEEVRIMAQDHTVEFYKKVGFAVDGEECEICGINHIPMSIQAHQMCCHCKQK